MSADGLGALTVQKHFPQKGPIEGFGSRGWCEPGSQAWLYDPGAPFLLCADLISHLFLWQCVTIWSFKLFGVSCRPRGHALVVCPVFRVQLRLPVESSVGPGSPGVAHPAGPLALFARSILSLCQVSTASTALLFLLFLIHMVTKSLEPDSLLEIESFKPFFTCFQL